VGKMGIRIVTWNVNGIRNPMSYEPFREKRTFAAMFDILEADILCIQECKIQAKDLTDDMVLVPGWDCFFSLPSHKKGYSGVAFYTKQATCLPIRAEEGITGVLKAPNKTLSYRDLPPDQCIGGYPTTEQLLKAGLSMKSSSVQLQGNTEDTDTLVDPDTGEVTPNVDQIDSEGRTILLEFPAFVIIGVYCPANTTSKRNKFRIAFLHLFEARIRNLKSMGKRIICLGDFNIIRNLQDVAGARDMLLKEQMTPEEFLSMPARRMLNHLLVDGTVCGERDEHRDGIMRDLTRSFNPSRTDMYTHWDTKKNMRPANFGSRIDYIICSDEMLDWFESSNIQEGLHGSDHCPVYAVLRDQINIGGKHMHAADLLNPPGYVVNGQRKLETTTKDLPALSGRLLPAFDKRRSIKDMFARKPSLPLSSSITALDDFRILPPLLSTREQPTLSGAFSGASTPVEEPPIFSKQPSLSPIQKKRSYPSSPIKPSKVLKRQASNTTMSKGPTSSNGNKQQVSLKGFFVKSPINQSTTGTSQSKNFEGFATSTRSLPSPSDSQISILYTQISSGKGKDSMSSTALEGTSAAETAKDDPRVEENNEDTVFDPIVSKDLWSKLFTKNTPRCGHNEYCRMYVSKKPGINLGRSFYMCARPMGPSGQREEGTDWRCGTFIWCSDWGNGNKDD
jgi:AP endonuclease-2